MNRRHLFPGLATVASLRRPGSPLLALLYTDSGPTRPLAERLAGEDPDSASTPRRLPDQALLFDRA